MSKQLLLAVPLACGIVGLVVDRQAASEIQAPPPAALDIPQLYDFTVGELDLPAAIGVPFDTVVSLAGVPPVEASVMESARS